MRERDTLTYKHEGIPGIFSTGNSFFGMKKTTAKTYISSNESFLAIN